MPRSSDQLVLQWKPFPGKRSAFGRILPFVTLFLLTLVWNTSAFAQQGLPPDAVRFQARDSLIFRFTKDSLDQKKRIGVLYGNSTVDHEKGTLSAGKITLDLTLEQVEASSTAPEDSLSYPILTRPGEQQELKSQRILFNYETGKGKFEAARVTVSDGTLIGAQVKNVSESVVFIEEGRYSTCPPDHMTYYIQANRLKVVDEEEIFFTNARLYLLDIPYPLPIPFGYIPASPDRRRSGLLQPTYVFQNTSRRGLGMQNLGWFQIINDYLTAQASFDLFTSGSFFHQSRVQYRRSDLYNGGLTIGYSREQGLEPTDPNFATTINKRISLQHSQQFNPFAQISANINLNTSEYFRRNSYDIDERASTNTTSRLAYQYRDPEGRFSFNTNAALTQQFTDNSVTLTGPSANFSARSFTPFARSKGSASSSTGSKSSWAENFVVNYRNDFSSRFQYRPLSEIENPANWLDALFNPSVYEQNTGNNDHVQFGLRQNLGISMGRLIPSEYLVLSANLSMEEIWVPSTIRKQLDPETESVLTEKVNGFATAREGQVSLNLTTTIYGIADLKIGSIERFRHTLRPSFSFAYRPDFSDEMWGTYRTLERGEDQAPITYSIFEESLFRGPSSGESRSMSYSFSNIFEVKQVKRDSTGEVKSKNIRVIDNLTLSGLYNFAADSLRFSDLSLRMSSRAVPNVSLQFSARFRPYTVNESGRVIDQFIWQDSRKLLQPLSYQISASTSFKGGKSGVQVVTPPYRAYDPFDQTYFQPFDPYFITSDPYDFRSPWSLSLSFNYTWTWRFNEDARKAAVLNVQNIRFKLSDRWDVSTRIGYDFIEKELTPSQFNLTRNMICWNLSFQFNPFGDFTYYFFRLSIDSGQIQNLFQKLPVLNNLERGSSPTGRRNSGF